jgi:hypothetical protein
VTSGTASANRTTPTRLDEHRNHDTRDIVWKNIVFWSNLSPEERRKRTGEVTYTIWPPILGLYSGVTLMRTFWDLLDTQNICGYLVLKHSIGEIDHLGLFNDSIETPNESLMHRIAAHIVISIRSARELDDKCVCDTILASSLASIKFLSNERTWAPSGELSIPPEEVLI